MVGNTGIGNAEELAVMDLSNFLLAAVYKLLTIGPMTIANSAVNQLTL